MKRMIQMGLMTFLTAVFFCGCGNAAAVHAESYTVDTKISQVVSNPVFGDCGRLIFPVEDWYYSGDTLGQLQLTWYSHINPDKTVEIANYLKDHAAAGDTVFYDIYTEAEKAADQAKRNTGLFFFKGEPGGKFAICNAGDGFAYVNEMEKSSVPREEIFLETKLWPAFYEQEDAVDRLFQGKYSGFRVFQTGVVVLLILPGLPLHGGRPFPIRTGGLDGAQHKGWKRLLEELMKMLSPLL